MRRHGRNSPPDTAGNPTHDAILRHIRVWLVHMRDAGCRQVHIDGSFICAKPNPGDYDACWDCTGVDPARIDANLLYPTPEGRLTIKRRFGGDIRPDLVCPPGSIRPYLRFFQTDRDGNPKGIVRPKGTVRIDLQKFAP